MEIFAIISTVVAVLGVAGTIFFLLTSLKIMGRLKEAEETIEDKNDALRDAFEAIHIHNEKLWDARHELNMLKNTKKPVGRPKGSKNKVTKPKFSQKEFDKKYGK
jgi:peptidoglycan hydrolase CwlO-like protein